LQAAAAAAAATDFDAVGEEDEEDDNWVRAPFHPLLLPALLACQCHKARASQGPRQRRLLIG
jgi:hypothetical protein